jgi:Uma2 family endonuclease
MAEFAPFLCAFVELIQSPTETELPTSQTRWAASTDPRYDARNWKNLMQVETTKKLFTVDDYYRMAEAGILMPEDRVELIDGEIIEMSPIGARHLGCVNRATRLFTAALGNRAVVSVQNPLRLNKYNEPEPDIVLLKPRADDYASKTPAAEDAILVVEVAETTLRYDRDVKMPLYAAAGVPEVWIENLIDDLLLVYRNPAGRAYTTSLQLRRGATAAPVALPDFVFTVEQLLV